MDQRRSKLVELAVNAGTPDEKVEEALKVLQGRQHQRDMAEDKFLSVREASKYLDISRVFLWQRVKKHGLKCYRLGGRVLFRKQDLDAHVLQPSQGGQA